MMSYTDLAILGVVRNDDYVNRTQLFKDYLWNCFGIPITDRRITNSVRSLISLWEKYIAEVSPEKYTYNKVSGVVKQVLGEEVHYDIMYCTRFYHPTSYLIKKGVYDIVSQEIMVDLWDTKNKQFWTY